MSFEELLLATGGYGVSRVIVCAGSPILDKTLSESALRSQDITVLAITRNGETVPNPAANVKILSGDELICFGKLDNIRSSPRMFLSGVGFSAAGGRVIDAAYAMDLPKELQEILVWMVCCFWARDFLRGLFCQS